MNMRDAKRTEKNAIIKIAKELHEWFTPIAVNNISTDFELNNNLIALEKNKVQGFLCYNSYNGAMKILWMGISKRFQRKGMGKRLIQEIEKRAKKHKLQSIEVETLPDEDTYLPYKKTREFYYRQGFTRVEYRKARVEGWDDQILLEKKI